MIVWIIVPKADNDFCLGYSNGKHYEIHKTDSTNLNVLAFATEEKATEYLNTHNLTQEYKPQDCWKDITI